MADTVAKQSICKVCKQSCGTAHKCISCNDFVHIICGKPQGQEEGYGQSVICSLCVCSPPTHSHPEEDNSSSDSALTRIGYKNIILT